MQDWKLLAIMYTRDGRFEAEAINAGIVGVGTTSLDAVRDFAQMALTLVAHADKAGARLTIEPEETDLALLRALEAGAISADELASRGIVGIGTSCASTFIA